MTTKTMQLWELCRKFIEDNGIDEKVIQDWQTFPFTIDEGKIQDFFIELVKIVKVKDDEKDRLPFGMVG